MPKWYRTFIKAGILGNAHGNVKELCVFLSNIILSKSSSSKNAFIISIKGAVFWAFTNSILSDNLFTAHIYHIGKHWHH